MAVTFQGTVAAYPIIGNGEITQNLFAIENEIASRVNVIIRRMLLQNDVLTALTSVKPLVKISRISAAATGGVILDKGKFDTTQTSNVNVQIRAALSTGSPITATSGTTIVWEQYTVRLHSAIQKVVLIEDKNALPVLIADEDFILAPGQYLLAQVVGATAASNPSLGNNWLLNVMWEEDSLPTFNISGVVTLDASPVTGAKVIVMQADDLYMSNPVFVEVKTTNASGEWSSTILSGKVGAAFVQYKSNGSLYTADGNPFLEE